MKSELGDTNPSKRLTWRDTRPTFHHITPMFHCKSTVSYLKSPMSHQQNPTFHYFTIPVLYHKNPTGLHPKRPFSCPQSPIDAAHNPCCAQRTRAVYGGTYQLNPRPGHRLFYRRYRTRPGRRALRTHNRRGCSVGCSKGRTHHGDELLSSSAHDRHEVSQNVLAP